MNHFESPQQPESIVKTVEKMESGIEGICKKCGGEGYVRPGFLKEKRVCGECHGKGFIKERKPTENTSYSWDTGLKH